MFIEYNPNPNNSRVGDCVIRAIAKAENTSWDKIYLDLCVYGLMCSDLPISNNVWGRYLNDRNYKYFSVPTTFYILLNLLYPEEENKNNISTQFQSTIPDLGESEFLQKIKGHDISKVISVLDELMEALKALNPQLYANTLRRFE